MSKTTVIYHSADFDGIFCREIARKFLPDAEFIGWNFGDPKIPVPQCKFYILDLSPECLEPDILPMADAGRMIWIDHHVSAINKFPGVFPGYRLDGVAACRLARQWFTNNDKMDEACETGCYPIRDCRLPGKKAFIERQVVEPLAVRLAGEYDIWDKRDPMADLFQHGLRSQCLDGIWPVLLSSDESATRFVTALLNQGQSVQYVKIHENESIIKSAGFDLDFEGLHFLTCNHARYNSLLFTAALKPEHDACLGFAWRGGLWTISLYHAPGKEHHDLSLIASKHGGGGHKGACGFTCKTLPFSLP